MKNYFKGILFTALFVLWTTMIAIVSPWMINEGGTFGMFALPFIWITIGALTLFSLNRITKHENHKNDEKSS